MKQSLSQSGPPWVDLAVQRNRGNGFIPLRHFLCRNWNETESRYEGEHNLRKRRSKQPIPATLTHSEVNTWTRGSNRHELPNPYPPA